MVEMVVRLSQRRTPHFVLVDKEAKDADIIIIDAHDAATMRNLRPEDAQRISVLWIDGPVQKAGQQSIMRPVQWSLLPMMLARALESAASTAPGIRSRATRATENHNVLVVDDSDMVRRFMGVTLKPFDVQVTFATSGSEALERVQQQPYLCVFLDVVMPGLDGYQVCRAIKGAKQTYGAPTVVMLTSKSSPFDKIRGKMSGCDAYLTKPVEMDKLLEILARIVPPAATTRSSSF